MLPRLPDFAVAGFLAVLAVDFLGVVVFLVVVDFFAVEVFLAGDFFAVVLFLAVLAVDVDFLAVLVDFFAVDVDFFAVEVDAFVDVVLFFAADFFVAFGPSLKDPVC